MSNAVYAALARQTGLMQELQVVANNLANVSTTGFKADRAVFAEMLAQVDTSDQPLSMGTLAGHTMDLQQGGLRFTGGKFDLAIQGDGYFAIDTPAGNRLTRAGHFQVSDNGNLVDSSGNNVLSAGSSPIQIPDNATTISIAGDGTISIDGEIYDQVGVFAAEDELQRDTGTMFIPNGGLQQMTDVSVVQGALEQSNVSPVLEIARMIEVQRAYEAGQSLFKLEDDRISQFIRALNQS